MHGQHSQDLFLLWERPPERYTLSREGDLRGKQKTYRPDDVWPDMWKFMSDASKKESKTKMGPSRNQSSTMLDN